MAISPTKKYEIEQRAVKKFGAGAAEQARANRQQQIVAANKQFREEKAQQAAENAKLSAEEKVARAMRSTGSTVTAQDSAPAASLAASKPVAQTTPVKSPFDTQLSAPASQQTSGPAVPQWQQAQLQGITDSNNQRAKKSLKESAQYVGETADKSFKAGLEALFNDFIDTSATTPVQSYYDLSQAPKSVREQILNGMTEEEYYAQREAELEQWGRDTRSTKYADEAAAVNEKYGVDAKTGLGVLGAVVGSGAQMAPSLAAGAVNPALGYMTTFSMGRSGGVTEALESGASYDMARAAGTISGAIETGIEMASGGIGGTGIGAIKGLGKETAEEIAKEVVEEGASALARKLFKDRGAQVLFTWAQDALGEGLEEFVTTELQAPIKLLYDDAASTGKPAADIMREMKAALPDALYSALVGSITGAVMGSPKALTAGNPAKVQMQLANELVSKGVMTKAEAFTNGKPSDVVVQLYETAVKGEQIKAQAEAAQATEAAQTAETESVTQQPTETETALQEAVKPAQSEDLYTPEQQAQLEALLPESAPDYVRRADVMGNLTAGDMQTQLKNGSGEDAVAAIMEMLTAQPQQTDSARVGDYVDRAAIAKQLANMEQSSGADVYNAALGMLNEPVDVNSVALEEMIRQQDAEAEAKKAADEARQQEVQELAEAINPDAAVYREKGEGYIETYEGYDIYRAESDADEKYEGIKAFGATKGTEVIVVKSLPHDANGLRLGNKILISETATKPHTVVFLHELSHTLQNSRTWNRFAKYAEQQMAKRKGADYAEKLKARYAKDGQNLTPEALQEEVAAHYVEEYLFNSQEAVDQMARYSSNIAGQFYALLRDMVRSFTPNGRGLDQHVIRKAERMFSIALGKADAQIDTNNVVAGNGSISAKYSLKTWNEADKAKIKKAAMQATGADSATVDKWIADVNSVARIVAENKLALDYDAADEYTAVKDNSEYKKTVDFSTLCVKRILLSGTLAAIQQQVPNRVLTGADYIRVRQMMADAGYEVSCGFCYVESRRKELGNVAQQFIEQTDHKGVTIYDLTTETGVDALRKSRPEVYQDFVKFNNKRGSGKVNLIETRTEYRGEIANFTKQLVNKLNDMGGLRLQSYSDFEVPHLLDMMQVVLDMSGKGLLSQAYTKVPNFADAFGNTGVKINLSIVGKGVDSNGQIIFDDVEGMPFAEAMRLRDKYSKNVGTILVGKDDAMILAAMADPRVDFIIPFHRSGWAKAEYEALGIKGYNDYTASQKEYWVTPRKLANGDTEKAPKSNLYPQEYWDFNLSGKENAERYLQICAEQGRVPKFKEFLVDNGDGSWSLQPDGSTDGYWKTLIDFKMYDNNGVGSPQQPVLPIFDNEVCAKMLSEYNGAHRNYPVAEDIVQQFMEEASAADPTFNAFRVNQPFSMSASPIDSSYAAFSLPQEQADTARDTARANLDFGRAAEIRDRWMQPVNNFNDWVQQNLISGQKPLENLSKDAEALVDAARRTGGALQFIAEQGLASPTGETLGLPSYIETFVEAVPQEQRESFDDYRKHLHNIDRMSLENDVELTAAVDEYNAFINEHPEYENFSDKYINRLAREGGDGNLAERYIALRDAVENLKAEKNKPVVGHEVNGKMVPYTAEESAEIVAEYEAAHPEWVGIVEAQNDWWDAFNRAWLVDTGLVSEQSYEALREKYPNYMPTYTAEKKAGSGIGRNRFTQNAIKEAKGSLSERLPYYQQYIEQIERVIKMQRRNDIAQYLVEYAAENPSVAARQGVALTNMSEEVVNALDAEGNVTEAETDILKKLKDGTYQFTAKVNGENVTLNLSEQMYNAVRYLYSNDFPGYLGDALKFLRKLTSFSRATITGYNPLFIATNFVRDLQTYLGNNSADLGDGGKYYLKAIKELNNKGEYYQQLKALGGISEGYYSTENAYKLPAEKSTARKVLGFVPNKIADASQYVESIPRLAEYMILRDKYGNTPDGRRRAALGASDVTTNFSRTAPMASIGNALVLYFNAGMQGLDKTVRQLKAAPVKTIAKNLAFQGVAAAALAVLNAKNPHYDELDDEVKDNYYLIPLGDPSNAEKFLRLPRSREYGALIGGLTARIIDGLVDGDLGGEDFGKETREWLGSVAEGFSPPDVMGNNILNTFTRIDLFDPESPGKTWYGGDIVPYRLQKYSPNEQYDSGTSLVGRYLAQLHPNLSPEKIDDLVDSYGGIVADILLGATSPRNIGETGWETAGNVLTNALWQPVVQRFTSDPRYSSGVVDDFYTALDAAELAAADRNKREGIPGPLQTPEEIAASALSKLSGEMSELYAAEREAYAAAGSARDKRSKSEALRSDINEIAARYEDVYNTALEQAQANWDKVETIMPFEDFYALAATIDADGNGSWKNEERENALNRASGLTKAEKAFLWSMFGGSDKSNPYD